MGEVETVLEISDKAHFVLLIVACIVALVFVLENLNKLKTMFGIKNKWGIHEEEQNMKIDKLETELKELKEEVTKVKIEAKEATKKRKEFEQKITKSLGDISNSLVSSRIDELRGRILEFSNACSTRQYNKESFDYILASYDMYEKLLAENNMTNGQTEMAIEYIKKKYAEYQQTGFPVY